MDEPSEQVGGAHIAVNGVRLAYSDIGNGVPLICLHGGMGIDANSLRVPGILELARRGIRLVIPDQRGHGRSSHSTPVTYTHDIWASDIHSLGRALELQPFALLGHSYGGFVALEYAKRWPESLTHLVLVSTKAGGVVSTDSIRTPSSDFPNQKRPRIRWPATLPCIETSAVIVRRSHAGTCESNNTRPAVSSSGTPGSVGSRGRLPWRLQHFSTTGDDSGGLARIHADSDIALNDPASSSCDHNLHAVNELLKHP